MTKNEILKILESAKDKNGDVPMRLVRQAFEKLPEPCEDAVSRQAAIDALCRRCDLAAEDDEPCTEKCNDIKTLEKLPSARPENADCIYCHEDSDGYVKPIEKNCHAFICFGMDGWELSLKANGWHGSAKIKYCPMCGRKLKNDK